MAAVITRNQVHLAIKASTFAVPDFINRKKTASIWDAKVYVSLQGNQLKFVQLNFLKRVIRYLFKGYGDTIFKTPSARASLVKVKSYVNGILNASPALKDFEAVLVPSASTKSDIICLRHIVLAIQAEKDPNQNNKIYLNDVNMRYGDIKKIPDKTFSEKFLKAALELANKHPMIGESLKIAATADTSPERAALNLALLRGILAGKLEEVPCQGLPISEEMKAAIREEVLGSMFSRDHLQASALKYMLTRRTYLCLEQMKTALWEGYLLPDKPYLDLYLEEGRVEQVRKALYDKLVGQGANPTAVSIYLNEDAFSNIRLLYHSEAQAYRQQFIQEKIDEIKRVLLSDIKQHYTIKVPAVQNMGKDLAKRGGRFEFGGNFGGALINGALDLFGYSDPGAAAGQGIKATGEAVKEVADKTGKGLEGDIYDRNIQEVLSDYLPAVRGQDGELSQISWRAQVVQVLRDPKYSNLIASRFLADKHVPQEVPAYLEWIKRKGSPIGLPEVAALSDINDTFSVIVQKVDEDYQWINHFNFGALKGSIVFCMDEKGSLQPMVLKTEESYPPLDDEIQVGHLDEEVTFNEVSTQSLEQ